MKDRAAVVRFLETQRDKYQYVVREPDASYLLLFSSKPKKYVYDDFWGYPPSELNGEPAIYIDNTDITEISWMNRSATKIDDWLGDQEVAE